MTHGGVLAAPTMTEELDGGVLLVSGFESLEKAQEVVDYITAARPLSSPSRACRRDPGAAARPRHAEPPATPSGQAAGRRCRGLG